MGQSIEDHSELNQGLKFSILLHLGVLVSIYFQTHFFQKPYQLIPPTLRVDLVGLPDLSKSELAKIKNLPIPGVPKDTAQKLGPDQDLESANLKSQKKKTPQKIEPLEPSDEMVIGSGGSRGSLGSQKNRGKKIKNILEKLKTLEKIRSQVQTDPHEISIKGNLVSQGTSLSQDAKESLESNYIHTIRDHLKENWENPPWLARKDLLAQVTLSLDKRGRLRGFKIIKSSGNSKFDELVRKTIAASVPFPPPPDPISAAVLVDGILVGFPL